MKPEKMFYYTLRKSMLGRKKEGKKERRTGEEEEVSFKGEDAHLKLWCESSFLNQMLCLFTL